MGIRIDGASDLINATDGSLTIEGQSINSTGIGTFSGGVKVGTAATIHSTGQFNIGVAATIFASGNATFAGIVTATAFVMMVLICSLKLIQTLQPLPQKPLLVRQLLWQ